MKNPYKNMLTKPVQLGVDGHDIHPDAPKELGIAGRIESGEIVDTKEQVILNRIAALRAQLDEALKGRVEPVDQTARYDALMERHPGASSEEIAQLMEDADFDPVGRTNEVVESFRADIREEEKNRRKAA